MYSFLKPNTFLDRYIKYCNELVDSPNEYHILNGLTLLSSVAHGFCFRGLARDRVNLWTLTLGYSSISRRSTSLFVAKELLEKVDPKLIGPGKFTEEGLYDYFNICPPVDKKKKRTKEEMEADTYLVMSLSDERKPGTLFFSEFGALLKGLEKKDYNAGLKGFLSDLFDNSGLQKRNLSNGKLAIINPYICIIGSSSKDWLEEAIKHNDITGGFLTRFIIYVDHGTNDKWKSPFELVSKDTEKFEHLRNHLAAINEFRGNQSIEIAPDAKEMFDSWAKEIEFAIREGILSNEEGTENTTLFARKVHHAKKMAALFALSRQVDEATLSSGVIIQLDDINNAIECISFFEEKSIGYLKALNKPAPINSPSERLEVVLKQAKAGLTRNELRTAVRMSAMQLQNELAALMDTEDCRVVKEIKPNEAGRTTTVYIHIDNIVKK